MNIQKWTWIVHGQKLTLFHIICNYTNNCITNVGVQQLWNIVKFWSISCTYPLWNHECRAITLTNKFRKSLCLNGLGWTRGWGFDRNMTGEKSVNRDVVDDTRCWLENQVRTSLPETIMIVGVEPQDQQPTQRFGQLIVKDCVTN